MFDSFEIRRQGFYNLYLLVSQVQGFSTEQTTAEKLIPHKRLFRSFKFFSRPGSDVEGAIMMTVPEYSVSKANKESS